MRSVQFCTDPARRATAIKVTEMQPAMKVTLRSAPTARTVLCAGEWQRERGRGEVRKFFIQYLSRGAPLSGYTVKSLLYFYHEFKRQRTINNFEIQEENCSTIYKNITTVDDSLSEILYTYFTLGEIVFSTNLDIDAFCTRPNVQKYLLFLMYIIYIKRIYF